MKYVASPVGESRKIVLSGRGQAGGNGLVRKTKSAPFTPQELEPQNLQINDLIQILEGTSTQFSSKNHNHPLDAPLKQIWMCHCSKRGLVYMIKITISLTLGVQTSRFKQTTKNWVSTLPGVAAGSLNPHSDP